MLYLCLFFWLLPTQVVMSQVTPLNFETLYSDATQLLEVGNYQAIIDGLGNQMIEAFPEETTGFILYARALEEAANNAILLSKWDVAESYSAQAYSLNPSYQHAMRWAEIAWQNGHNKTAIEAYQKASETTLGKSQAWPHINMATIYSFSGNKVSELSHLEAALELLNTPSTGKEEAAYIDVLLKLATCYKASNNIEKEKNSLVAVLQKDPLNTKAIQALENLQSTIE